jgi:hypothetical protein
MSQQRVARQLGVSHQQLHKLETAKNRGSISQLLAPTTMR